MVFSKYPMVGERLKAAFTDSIVMIVLFFLFAFVFEHFKDASDMYRMFALLFSIVLYEPLCISLFGATLGHMMFGIKVKQQKDETKNINILMALIRYFVKLFLGIISFVVVANSEKRLAIHDRVVGSVVLYSKQPTHN